MCYTNNILFILEWIFWLIKQANGKVVDGYNKNIPTVWWSKNFKWYTDLIIEHIILLLWPDRFNWDILGKLGKILVQDLENLCIFQFQIL